MLMKTTRANPAQIAAAVPKSDEHVALDRDIASRRAERDRVRGEMIALIHKGAERHAHRITELDAVVSGLESEIAPMRGRQAQARAHHAARLDAAFAPLRREIACKVIEIIDDLLKPEIDALAEIQSTIEGTSGVPMTQTRVPSLPLTDYRARLCQLAGRAPSKT